jgi:predicted ATPase
MQLNKIGLENFRVFEKAEIEIKPITIITGANSSGKSSVFKALMLLEDNIKKSKLATLDFSGVNHSLGSFELIKNKKVRKNSEVIFSLYLDNTKDVNKDFENAKSFIFRYHYIDNKKKKNNGFLYKLSVSIVLHNQDITEEKNVLEVSLDKTIHSTCTINMDLSNILKVLSDKNTIYNDYLKVQMFPIRSVISDIIIASEKEKRLAGTERDYQNKTTNRDEYLQDEQKKYLEELNQRYEEQINSLEEELNTINDAEQKIELKSQIIATKQEQEREINKFFDPILSEYYNSYKEDITLLNDESAFKNQIYQEIFNKIQDAIFPFMRKSSTLKLKKIKFNTKRDLIQSIFENTSWKTEIEQIIKELNQTKLEKVLDWESIEYAKKEIETLPISQIISAITIKGENNTTSQKSFFEFLVINFIESIAYLTINKLPFISLPAYRAYQSQTYNITTNRSTLENIISDYLRLDYSNLPVRNSSKKFIKVWFNKFGIGDDFFLESVRNAGTEFYFKIKKDKLTFNLADLGFGISQLIPIILTCANPDNKGKLICIEEPETNLHPKFQSMLAEMFVDAHKTFNVQFALETHSEYLIMKLQELVLETSGNKKINHKNIILYYFDHGQILSTKVDEFGNIDESIFRTGFFDITPNFRGSFFNKQIKKSVKPIFVEGGTDKIIIEKAISVFSPQLKGVNILKYPGRGGYGKVKNGILNWAYDNEKKMQCIAIFDCDHDALSIADELENTTVVRKNKNIKIIKLPRPLWLQKLYEKEMLIENKKNNRKKVTEFEYELEHLYPISMWLYAKNKDWLEKNTKRLSNLNNDDNSISQNIFFTSNGFENEQIYIDFQINEDKKSDFAKYVCSQLDMDTTNGWNDLKGLVGQIEIFFEKE